MYVSSFSTYINTESSHKTQDTSAQKSEKATSLFETNLSSKTVKGADTSAKFPISYISNYKALNNQQKLQDNPKSQAEVEFVKIQTFDSAKNAYIDNSKIFSLFLKPKTTIDQTPKIDNNLPKNIQDIKENNLRHTMVNTYISNENYYKTIA